MNCDGFKDKTWKCQNFPDLWCNDRTEMRIHIWNIDPKTCHKYNIRFSASYAFLVHKFIYQMDF